MKRSFLPGLGLSMLSISTAACATFPGEHQTTTTSTNWKCDKIFTGDINCSIGGEIRSTWGGGGGGGGGGDGGGGGGGGGGREPDRPIQPFVQQAKGVVAQMLAATNSFVIDAEAFEVDTAGTTVPVPSNGYMQVVLRRSSNNSIVAAQAFPWSKSGTKIRFNSPDAVNNWAYANAADADKVTFDTVPFTANFQGVRTASSSMKYENEVLATGSRVFNTSSCPDGLMEVTELCSL